MKGAGAFLNGRRLRVAPAGGLEHALAGLTDFAFGDVARAENEIHLRLVAELVPRSLRIRVHGAAAVDLAWLAAGRLSATAMLSTSPGTSRRALCSVRGGGPRVRPRRRRAQLAIALHARIGA